MSLPEVPINQDPSSGFELMCRDWQNIVIPAAPDLDDYYWNTFPGENTLAADSSNIFWIHSHPLEPSLKNLLDKEFFIHFKAFVFVSNWQYEVFCKGYGIPTEKCYVIKNAIKPFEVHEKPKTEKIKLIYHSNPFKGLDVLLEALKLIPDPNIELNVYSNLDFRYQYFKYCEDLAKKDPRVILHGGKPNSVVREALKESHIFAYPVTTLEPSSICTMEALAAGCSVLTSNIAGMPETCMGLAKHYGAVYNNKEAHVVRFADELHKTIQEYRSGKFDSTLQVQIANKQFSWETRLNDWIELDKQLWRNPYGN